MYFCTRFWDGVKLLLLIGCVLQSESVMAQTRWARQAGGAGQDNARKLAIDGSGNAYVVGNFTGPAQFGAITLGQAGTGGKPQAYLAKYNAQGEVLWAKEAPAIVFADVAIDADGNPCVVGGFSGSGTFGGTVLTSQADFDVVLAKYDPQGNVLWARAGGNTPGSMLSVDALALDPAGNVYIAGGLSGSVNIGGSAGALTSEGRLNLFVAKYDSQGNPLWARQGGGKGNECAAKGLGVDAAGNAYLSGFFGNIATFGSTTLTNPDLATTGGRLLLVKYSSNGAVVWAKGEGGPGEARIDGIAVDGQGNSFITGTLGGTPLHTNVFGPYTFQVGGFDGFLVKHDADGNVAWASQIGGPSTEYGTGVAVDKAGNGYVTGIFGSSVATWGPTTTLASVGNKLVFAVKYDPQGKVLAAQREALCGVVTNQAIAVGPNQDIYLAGQFFGATSFASTLLTGNSYDAFITRLGDLSVPSTPDSFTCNGQAAPPVPVPAPTPVPAPAASEIIIPNILTPNGDGLNDKLEIKGLVDNLWSFTVYSRWGNQVYTTASYQKDWDPAGLPAGIYYYLLHHATGPGYRGWIQVVR